MKKFNILDFLTVLVFIAIIASLVYAFNELYFYRSTDEATTTETTATETTTTEATTKINWSEEFEKSFRSANSNYSKVADDVNKNLTTINPAQKPTF